MLLLLGILKRNHKYYMNVVNIDRKNEIDDYQFINPYVLNSCANISVQHYLSNKQDPKEYLKGEFDVTDLIVDDNKLRSRINDYQIISIYYDEDNKPCLYKSIDRAGNISMHDISEFEYTKRNCILGDDINELPSFIEHRNLEDAYEYLRNNKLDESKLADMPVGLAKHYLIGVKGFKEGYHTVTEINHGVAIDVHEHMLFNGTVTLKLVEYIPKDKDVFLTKQDYFSNPYPKERTVDFLPSSIILLGSKRLMPKFCKLGTNTEFSFYNPETIKFSIPFNNDCLAMYDRYIKSKGIYSKWRLDYSNNIDDDIYKNILPNEILKLPNRFYRDMKSLPFSVNRSYQLERENIDIERWIYTVALFICWQYYTPEFKKKLRPIIKNYPIIYKNALNNLVLSIGPRDSLVVMKWLKNHLREEMKNILNSDLSVIDENECLFTFYQNNYSLPESLKVYLSDTVDNYGGVDKLREDFATDNNERKIFIINTLEKIEKSIRSNNELEIGVDIEFPLKKLTNRNKKTY